MSLFCPSLSLSLSKHFESNIHLFDYSTLIIVISGRNWIEFFFLISFKPIQVSQLLIHHDCYLFFCYYNGFNKVAMKNSIQTTSFTQWEFFIKNYFSLFKIQSQNMLSKTNGVFIIIVHFLLILSLWIFSYLLPMDF